jgi:hypothetical protein
MSRRKLMASLGMAGAAIAAGGLLGREANAEGGSGSNAGPAREIRAELEASSGASMVGFLQSGSAAVPRTVYSKLCETVSVEDFGAVGDGVTDDTAALLSAAAYVNAIPNPDGVPVELVFTRSRYLFGTTLKFTRPVHLNGCRSAYMLYTGSGNAIQLGPDGLTGLTDTQKYYSVYGLNFRGGTTGGCAFYVAPWVIYPSFDKCRFDAFGGNESWAIFCQYNSWSIYVRDCEFWGSTPVDNYKRNFFKAAGVDLDGVTLDYWACRANIIDCWIYSGGYYAGGTAVWFSGWKSRIQGGGIEGPFTGVVIAAGCNDVELSGVYWESLFANTPAPRFLQLSAPSGDAYWPAHSTVKRLKIKDMYGNMHNTDSLASNGRFALCAQNIKVIDLDIDGLTLVHSSKPIFELPDIAGHRGISYRDIKHDGNIGPETFLFETQYANTNRPGYGMTQHNYVKVPDFSAIVTGVTGAAAPLNDSFGIDGLTITSDGTGGSYSVTKVASDNTAGTSFELYRIGQQLSYGLFRCTAAPSGQTYYTVNFDIDAAPTELQGENCVLSFWAKANNAPVTLKAIHAFRMSGLLTEANNPQVVAVGDWKRYAMQISVQAFSPGFAAAAGEKQQVSIVLPAGVLFSLAIAGVVFNKGDVAIPLSCSR